MRGRLRRLAAMSGHEWRFRLRTTTRTHLQRAATRLREPAWDRRTLHRVLASACLEAPLADAIDQSDWRAVDQQLRQLLRSRPSRFVLDPAAAAQLRDTVLAQWPDAAGHAVVAADRLLEGEYDLLGYRGLRFTNQAGEIDWHLDPVHGRRMPRAFWADVPYLDPACGDHKVIWELNRHQHWLALGRALWLTGDRRYAAAIGRQLTGWLGANPPLVGANWASMLELGFRAMSWVWAVHFLIADPAADAAGESAIADLLIGIDRQLTHVEQNLSYFFSPNTHLTGEALSLYVAGAALPELRASARWIDTGRAVLLAEIDRQICADGGHAERSTHYHRYTLDFYLLAWLTAERLGDVDAADRFRAAVTRLAPFMRAMADRDGQIPLIGDDDGGMLCPITGRDPRDVRDSLALAALVLDQPGLAPWGLTEECGWLAGAARTDQAIRHAASIANAAPTDTSLPVRSQLFHDTGFVTAATRDGDHLVFDTGVHGYLNGGHAHADALSVTLAVDGHPLLIDPGTATYTMDPALRDRMRHTAAHNTLTVDDRPSSVPAGPFHWLTRADAQLERYVANPIFVWAEASHDAFGGARHRRRIVYVVGAGWLLLDDLDGSGRHAVAAHWQFDPAWQVERESRGRLRASAGDGRLAWLLHEGDDVQLERGGETLGWCAPRYGATVATAAARVCSTLHAPASLVSWVGATSAEPSLERIVTDRDAAVAVRLRLGPTSAVTVLAGAAAAGEEIGITAADYHTNAALLHYAVDDTQLRRVVMAGGTHALAVHDARVSITAERRLDDVAAEWCGDCLDLWSSSPSALHLHGDALRRVRAVRLNGRDWPRPDAGSDTMTIAAANWAEVQETASVCAA